MTNKEAIDDLKFIAETKILENLHMSNDVLALAIKALEERPQGGWVLVSERLPEKYKRVIVTDIETRGTYVSRYIGDGYWECDNGPFKNRIIAWQPLPEPYQEATQE